MNPKVAKKGTSFKGAGLYYLHDKNKATTQNRVAFTETVNLPTDDPQTALKVMAYTAMHQDQLKAASGQVVTGRKTKTTVYSYSLSWHPSENPNQQEMLEAARETLEVLGLQEHEALLVAHNDTKHPHIHVIVNRVHPETGILDTHSCDQLRLSEWAEEYQKQRGQDDFTPQRTINNEKRRRKRRQKSGKGDQSGFVKYEGKDNVVDFQSAKKDKLKVEYDHRAPDEFAPKLKPLDAQTVRKRLYAEKEARIDSRRKQVKDAYRPKWAALYAQQRTELKNHEKNLDHAIYRVTTYLKNRKPDEKHVLLSAFRAFFGKTDFIKTDLTKPILDKHQDERKELSTEVYQQNRTVMDQENRYYKEQVAELKALQPPTPPQPKPKQTSDEFQKRVAERTRRRKRKRGDRGKGHGRERD